jgi:hypothetical protein
MTKTLFAIFVLIILLFLNMDDSPVQSQQENIILDNILVDAEIIDNFERIEMENMNFILSKTITLDSLINIQLKRTGK